MRSLIVRYRRHRAHISRGQSLTEFALVLPVFLLIVLIGLDFGRAYLGWVSLQQSARIAANFASIHPTAWTGGGLAADQAKYQQLIINDAATINCELPKKLGVVTAPDPVFTPGNAVGDQAQVSITCGFTLITPMIGTLLPNPLPLTASSVFPVRVGVVVGGGSIPGVGPVANFIADTTSCTAPCTVNFSDQSTGAPTSWTWDFQDDGTADDTSQNPTFVYTTPGLYSVKLTVAHPTNGSDSRTRVDYIDVQPAAPGMPIADFSGTPLAGSAPLTVGFTDLSTTPSPTAITNWSWTFGDGGTANGNTPAEINPQHQYTSAGTFTVTLTVTNDLGNTSTKTVTGYVVVTTPLCLVPNFTASGGMPVANVPAAWTAAGFVGGPPVIYTPILPWNNPARVRDQLPNPGTMAPCLTQVLTVSPTNNSLP